MEVGQAAITAITRPEAPEELTEEQRAEWYSVVNRLPADWFPRETHGMLAQYCRHVVSSRKVAQLITAIEKKKRVQDVEEYDRLLKMQEREGRAMSALATRMRMSQQSTLDREKRKGGTPAKKPWNN
jgi:hypothetical protein